MKKHYLFIPVALLIIFFIYKSFEYPKTIDVGRYDCDESTINSVLEIQRSDFIATVMYYELMYTSQEKVNERIFFSSIRPHVNQNGDISLLPLNSNIPTVKFEGAGGSGLEIYLPTGKVEGRSAFSLDEYNDIAKCLQNNINIINADLANLPNSYPKEFKSSTYSIEAPPLVGIAYVDQQILHTSIKKALGPESEREFIIGENKITFDYNGGISTYDYNLKTIASIFTLNPNEPELTADSDVNYFDAKNNSGVTMREYLRKVQEKLNIVPTN